MVFSCLIFVGDVYLLQEGDCISYHKFSVFLTTRFTLMGIIYLIRSVNYFYLPN